MFADISPRYDLLNHVLSLNIDRLWRRRTARELAVGPGDRALDVCTGTADLALELANRMRSADTGQVVGADFCPEMVTIGESKRSRRGESRIDLIVADTMLLPFADASFDVVTVAFGIRNVADLGAGLAEMVRVLRPGGRLGILEFTTPKRKWLARLYGYYFHRLLPRIGRWLSGHPAGGEAYAYLPATVAEFPRPDDLASVLEGLGLSDVRYRLLAGGIAAIHLARRPVPGPRHAAVDSSRATREEAVPWKKR